MVVAVAVSVMMTPLSAQWFNYPTPGIPRTPDGKANLSAPAPHMADGRLDVSGIWLIDRVRFLLNLAVELKPGETPFQPWAEELYNKRMADNGKDDPEAKCLPQGTPKMDTLPWPFKLMNTPDEVVILYETNNLWRQVFTDGRALPKDPNPTWLGYSVGHWEPDAFVVDTNGLGEKMWLDTWGHPHTEALHVTERFKRTDFGHMDIQITLDDPKAYTKPWSFTQKVHLVPDTDLLEFVCLENSRDVPHLVGK